MTNLVRFIVLEAVLAPICDPQDPVYSLLEDVDGNDEWQLKEVMQKYIKPYCDSFDERSKQVINDSIRYFFSPDAPQKDLALDALPTPFSLPKDVSKFCLLLGSELGIKPTKFKTDDCKYSDDLNLVYRLRRNRSSFKVPPCQYGDR